MSFNINKCHTLHAHRKKHPILHTYTMDNTPVTPVTHQPYLGIELQSDLRWTTHIHNTTNKAQKTLNMLKRNLKQASTAVKSQAYKTIVRPQLEYASAIWDPHTTKYMYNLNKIQTMQQDDYSHYTIQLKWPSLSVRRLQSRLVLFYKICYQEIAIHTPLLFTNTPQNYTPHLKHKRKQIQSTQHINRYIQIQLLPLNNHRLEFTATQSVCDSNSAVLQGRPNPLSLPQHVTHM